MTKTIVGLFRTMDEAQNAVQGLMDSGIRRDDISVVARDEQGGMRQNAVGDSDGAAEGAGAGALGGTVVGGAIGLLVGAGLLAIPGIGPVLAAGPLAAAIGTAAATAGAGALGAGIGAATGGLMGGLIGAGVPEEDARIYNESVQRGDVLVSATADDSSAANAHALMQRSGAIDIEGRRGMIDDNAMATNPGRTGSGRAMSGDMGGADVGNTGSDYARGLRDQPVPTDGPDYARGMHNFSDYEGDFRSHYQLNRGTGTRSYEDYAPAYRYGYTMAGDTRLRGDRWEDVEMDAQRSWEHDRPNSWDEFKATVRYAWERARGLR
jgi:hypothetical protein